MILSFVSSAAAFCEGGKTVVMRWIKSLLGKAGGAVCGLSRLGAAPVGQSEMLALKCGGNKMQ
jgi:hypothetical protein